MEIQELVAKQVEEMKKLMDPSDFHDFGFLESHVRRFSFLLKALGASFGKSDFANTAVLELGSYHLHLSVLLKGMGFLVKGVELPIFVQKPAIARRATEFGITNRPYLLNELGKPIAIPYEDSSVDLVVCTEMLEHITFNPVRFWSEVYRVMRDGALLYLTTPNSLSLFSVLAQLKRLVTLDSIGITVTGILNSITSGHHWKEYSSAEIKEYFTAISSDFELITNEYYCYRDFSESIAAYRTLYWIQENIMPRRFRSELLMVFRVRKKYGIQLQDPDRMIELGPTTGFKVA